jgi:hypothetical protein
MNQKVYPHALNLDTIAQKIQDVFGNDGFEVQKMGTSEDIYVQLRKAGIARKLTGMDQAITVHMQRVGATTSVTLGQAAWMSKAAGMGIGIFVLAPLIVTSALGIWAQHNLPGRVWKLIDEYAISQATTVGVQVGEMGTPLMGLQQGVHCPHCGVTNTADSQYCNACGTKLK